MTEAQWNDTIPPQTYIFPRIDECTLKHDFAKQVKKTQRQRKSHIRDTCKSWIPRQNLTTAMLDKILVDDQHRILYCVIPKVGCTNWKKVFVQMSGKLNISRNSTKPLNVHDEKFMRNLGFHYLSDYSKNEIVEKIQTYYKFMFVRNPLERLLSAYRDKFTQYNKYTKFFQYKYGRMIIGRYRKNPNRLSVMRGHDVTFAEFVKYVIDLPARHESFNPHWVVYHKICHPCKISYNFIGKMENIDTDAAYVINRIQSQSKNDSCSKSFPPPPKKRLRTGSVLHKFYHDIPAGDIQRLIYVYKRDFQLFGYNASEMALSVFQSTSQNRS